MIKLSKLTDYAVTVLAAMGEAQNTRFSVNDLCDLTKIPEPTIAKIMKILSKTPYIDAHRGANGGYELTHSTKDVPIRAIIEVMEGRIQIVDCAGATHNCCQFESACGTKIGWDLVNNAIISALDHVFLSDMIQKSIQSKPIKITHNPKEAATSW